MRRFWAVTRHTFIEALRLRMTAGFLIALLAALVLTTMISDRGNPRDRVQTFLVYGVGLSGMVVSVLTILLGCTMVCREQARRYVFAPLTKPIRRWQYVLGRWTGVVLLQALLVAGIGAAIYGTAQVLRMRVTDPAQQALLDNQVFSARVKLSPASIDRDVLRLTGEILEEMRAGGRLEGLTPPELAQARGNAELEARVRLQDVQPYGRLRWRFEALPAPRDERSVVEFHFIGKTPKAPSGARMYGIWTFTSDPDSGQGVYLRWPSPAPPEQVETFPVDMDATIFLPAKVIGPDGQLQAEFWHLNPVDPANTFQTTLTVPAGDMYLVYPVSAFAPNFARVMLLVLFVQLFLAATTLMAGTWLSFPVASLLCFSIYLVGLLQGFLTEATQLRFRAGFWDYLGHYVYGGLQYVLPDFTVVKTTGALVDGLVIPWAQLLWAGGLFVLFWTGLALASAALIFARRELAAQIVE